MDKYIDIIDGMTEVEFILDELQDIIYQGKMIDAIDERIFNHTSKMYFGLAKAVNDLKKLAEKAASCSNDTERLDCYLKNIYKAEQSDE